MFNIAFKDNNVGINEMSYLEKNYNRNFDRYKFKRKNCIISIGKSIKYQNKSRIITILLLF